MKTFFYFLAWNTQVKGKEIYREKTTPYPNLVWHCLTFSSACEFPFSQYTSAIFLKCSGTHLFKRFLPFAANGNKINFSLFLSWRVNVTVPGRTTSAKRIASAFPEHSLQSCRGIKKLWVTFTYFISGKCMLIWGLYLSPKYSHFKDIGVESFHEQGEGSGKNHKDSTSTTFGTVQLNIVQNMMSLNTAELWGWTVQLEGKMVSPICCTARLLHNCKPERLYFGHISPSVTKVQMQSC